MLPTLAVLKYVHCEGTISRGSGTKQSTALRLMHARCNFQHARCVRGRARPRGRKGRSQAAPERVKIELFLESVYATVPPPIRKLSLVVTALHVLGAERQAMAGHRDGHVLSAHTGIMVLSCPNMSCLFRSSHEVHDRHGGDHRIESPAPFEGRTADSAPGPTDQSTDGLSRSYCQTSLAA